MKKLLLVVISAILVLSLVSCSTSGERKEIVGDDSESGKNSGDTEKKDKEVKEFTIDEQLCFEYEGLKVTAKSAESDSIWGKGINILAENDSGKDYSVSTRAVIVNNCMITSLFSCNVAAGKKSNETLYLSSSSLEAAGITDIGQIEIYFYVYDGSSYETLFDADCVTIKTSLYDTMDVTADDSGHELYNKNGIRIIGKYVDENTFWGSSVLLYIENTTKEKIIVSCDDMSINGFMVEGYLYTSVYAGKYAVDTITVLSDDLEKNGITSIDSIELKFRIIDSDTYKTIDETEAITFSAK